MPDASANTRLRSIARISSTEWVIPTTCHDCFIRVESMDGREDDGWVIVSLFSNHTREWDRRLRNRIRDAWRMLRGYPNDAFEMVVAEEVDDLIETLRQAKAAAWGPWASASGSTALQVTVDA